MQTDCIGSCEKKVNTEISQALLGTTNLFRIRREESAAKEEQKPKHYYIRASIIAVPRERLCRLFAIFYRNCTAVP